MPKHISQRIYDLHDKGNSPRQIMHELHVSVATVKFHLRKRKDVKVLEFANKLQEFAVVAPNELCKKEINASIQRILKNNYRKFEILYPVILKYLSEGCETVSDLNYETDYSISFLKQVLYEMKAQDLIRVEYAVSRSKPNRYFPQGVNRQNTKF